MEHTVMPGEFPAFLASELGFRPAAQCRFHVIPVPYEATVSYGGGTARGPGAILEASQQLEVWTGRSNPSEQGIFTHAPVDCEGSAEEVLERIEGAVARVFVQGPGNALPVLLGGEHSITLGALRALKQRCGHFGIVHFDAHADLRETYSGTPYSHACVMRRAVDDLGLALFQIGVRSLSPEEETFRKQRGIARLDARDLYEMGMGKAVEAGKALLPKDFPERVFLSFDVDALDASVMPATGTPEPGGLLWWDALRLTARSLAGRTCLGFDVVELAPIASMPAPSYTAARLVYELMGLMP